jgi:GDP-D-mannose dehydratase
MNLLLPPLSLTCVFLRNHAGGRRGQKFVRRKTKIAPAMIAAAGPTLFLMINMEAP